MRDQDITTIQGRIRELAIEQISDQAEELLQLRAMLEHERVQNRAWASTVEIMEQDLAECRDALTAAKASITVYQVLVEQVT